MLAYVNVINEEITTEELIVLYFCNENFSNRRVGSQATPFRRVAPNIASA